ncbi:hypothetical protein QWI17_01430 [Gilvimarinus sp. SDUM040013]|uniref:Uncharacterized protein n=1 Tax=Gilvimarinus gilvus TaxID=3058038 RepID=A0ABU4S5X5_9GAMM|nr:hypothetical protein [Gilvimarinus sp. SDUM040013]MDO3384493.1 hypothetical protein [Gilvimarinus sp. SDUM040013]MDX6850734.1 hypothetical protein [Gilvimarinus sp. SDUM040013]
MYEKWNAVRWSTQLSDIRSLQMVTLVDDGQLTITVEDLRSPARKRWSIIFEKAPIYQNILEEFRFELWHKLNIIENDLGFTLKYPDSVWHKMIGEKEPLLDDYYPNMQHFQIVTEDDVIDVLSEKEPAIVEIEPAASGEPAPGKSIIHYREKNREEDIKD